MASRDRCDEEIKEYESMDDEGQGRSKYQDGDKGLRLRSRIHEKYI
jgi:hypothetical protein